MRIYEYIWENYNEAQVVEIAMMYVNLYRDIGDNGFGCIADELLRKLAAFHSQDFAG